MGKPVKQTAENQIGKGKPGPGRSKGTPNKTTAVLKDAILLAAEQVGSDGAGQGGLVGYLTMVAKADVKAFAGLLGRVMPLQIAAKLTHEMTTKEQKDAAVAAFLQAETENRSRPERLQ